MNRLFLTLSIGCIAPATTAQSLVTIGPTGYACAADEARLEAHATSGTAAFHYDAAAGLLRVVATNTSPADTAVLTNLWFTAPSGRVKLARLVAVEPPGAIDLSFKHTFDGDYNGNGSQNPNRAQCFGMFVFALSAGDHGITDEPTEFTLQLSGTGLDQLTSESFATASSVNGDVAASVAMRFLTPTGAIVMANSEPAATVAASCVIYNGNDINPIDLHCLTLPVITSQWRLDTTPNAGTELAVLALSLAPIAPEPLFDGELLIDLGQSDYRVSMGQFEFMVPSTLMGAEIYLQAARIDQGLIVVLNAIHATLGL